MYSVRFEEYINVISKDFLTFAFSLTEIFLNQSDNNTKVIYLWGDPTLAAKRPQSKQEQEK